MIKTLFHRNCLAYTLHTSIYLDKVFFLYSLQMWLFLLTTIFSCSLNNNLMRFFPLADASYARFIPRRRPSDEHVRWRIPLPGRFTISAIDTMRFDPVATVLALPVPRSPQPWLVPVFDHTFCTSPCPAVSESIIKGRSAYISSLLITAPVTTTRWYSLFG